MPSHLDEPECKKVRPDWVTDTDIVGNKEADRLAAEAGERASNMLDLNVVNRVIRYTQLVKSIQLRLAIILCSLPSRPHHTLPKMKTPKSPVPRISKELVIQASEHNFTYTGDQIRCTNFGSSSKVGGANVWQLIKGNCKPFQEVFNKPACVLDTVTIGLQTTHSSHKIMYFKGITFCDLCGFWTQQRLQKLYKPCVGIRGRNTYGQQSLEKIYNDRCPKGLKAWPLP